MNILVHKKVEKTVQNIDCNFVKKFVRFFWITKRCWLEESCQRFLKWSHEEKSIYSQQSTSLPSRLAQTLTMLLTRVLLVSVSGPRTLPTSLSTRATVTNS